MSDAAQRLAGVQLRPETLLQILEVTRKLAAPFDLQTVLAEVGEAARTVLRAERATVWLLDPVSGRLVLSGTPSGSAPVTAALDQGILGLTARTHSVVNVPDRRREPLFDPAVDLDQDNDVRCLLSVPLVENGTLVGVLQVVDRDEGPFTAGDERVAETLAAQCVVFIQRERLTRSAMRAQELDRELRLAREIQMSTLPSEMPRMPGYDLAGQFCPADQTGGDTFDLVRLGDGRLFVLLGDASGHGIGPALSATQLAGMLRVALRLGATLDSILAEVNDQLVEDLPEEHFVTAFLGTLDAERHVMSFHSAGQGPLLHFQSAAGRCAWRTPTTFPMGFMHYPPLAAPAEIQLAPDDIMALITDGVFEAEDERGNMFGTEGVEQVLARHHHRSMAELMALLLEAVHRHLGGRKPADDITIVLIARREPGAAATTVHRYFPRTFDSIAPITDFIGQFLEARSLASELHNPVSFIVEELFTNMVKYNPGNEHDVALSLGHTPDRLTVRLMDFDVAPFDLTAVPRVDVDRPLQDRRIGGLGLHLVRKMADTLEYEHSERRTTITFTKVLR